MIFGGLAWLAGLALAQNVGVGGTARAGDDGDLADLGSLWRPETQSSGGAGIVSGLGLRMGDLERPFGGSIAAMVGLHKRIGVSAVVPFPGTMRFGVPIGVVVPDRNLGGFGLSVVPEFALFGDSFGGEGTLALGYGGPSWQIVANLGGGLGPLDGVSGVAGPRASGGLGGSVELARTLAVRLEADVESDLAGALDLESNLSIRGRYRSGLSWTLGAAVAPLREENVLLPYAQIGFVLGRTMDRDADLDGVVDAEDVCRHEPETANGFEDIDGCPDELAGLKVMVLDLVGHPVVGASLQLGNTTGVTGDAGDCVFPDLMPDSEPRVLVDAAGFTTQFTEGQAVYSGENLLVVILDWIPTPLRVSARDASTGAPVDAHIRIEGPGNVDTQDLGEDGVETVELRPGTWRVVVYADFFEPNEQTVEIVPNQAQIDHSVLLGRAALQRSKEEVLNQVVISFEPGDDAISEQWQSYLEEVAHVLLVNSFASVTVRAGSDAQAQAVIDNLADRGVRPERMSLLLSKDHPADQVSFQVLPQPLVTVPQRLYFSAGSSALLPGHDAELDAIAAIMAAHPVRQFTLLAHADASDLAINAEPADGWADELSIARARAVRAALIERGVRAERLSARALGLTSPVGSSGVFERLVEVRALAIDDLTLEVVGTAGVADLPAEWKASLVTTAARMKVMPEQRVRLVSTRVANEDAALAAARAEQVVAGLVEAGVAPSQLVVDIVDGALPVVRATLLEPRELSWPVRFAEGSAELSEQAQASIEHYLAELARHPDERVQVIGFTGAEEDASLALARAVAVRDALQQAGVADSRLEPGGGAAGSGELEAATVAVEGTPPEEAPPIDEAAASRVELRWILAKKGVAVRSVEAAKSEP